MTPEEANPRVHHATVKGARSSLARKAISQESYAAVLRGELSLEAARELGRDRGPSGAPLPVSRLSKDDTRQECWCGCQQLTSPGKRWRQGHDQRAKGTIKRAVSEGKVEEISDKLREYARERGLI